MSAQLMKAVGATLLLSIATPLWAVTLHWQDHSNNENGFVIERKIGSGGWKEIDRVSPNVTTYNDALQVAGDEEYCYRVRAYNKAGYSEHSNETCLHSQPSTPTASNLQVQKEAETLNLPSTEGEGRTNQQAKQTQGDDLSWRTISDFVLWLLYPF